MKRKIEILAPAGSYEGMKAAMNAGCDAIYIGGNSFGARAYANNLDEDSLKRAIDEAHIRGKQLYLTVNTLVKEKERTEALYQFLEPLYLQGLDAVIVQDVGIMHFIHHNFPDLPIHASTQTTLTMAEGANLLKPYGVTRLVTARELSLHEIKTIRANTDLEIETFVHGALCYCYSGQCFMSSIIGGRSGNRGRCAQPCRMPYQLISDQMQLSAKDEKYLLSPKDINTVSLIPELVEAGIDSFKIEGRMKRPEYAAIVSYMYRKYVDLYFELGKEGYQKHIKSKEFEQDMIQLQDIYNRGGFSTGYGKNYHGKSMMSLYRPNHSGVLVGNIISIKGSQASIKVSEELHPQDILEIRGSNEQGHEFTVKDAHSKGDVLTTNVGKRPMGTQKEQSKDRSMFKLKIGDLVYRTKNNQLLEQISDRFIKKDQKYEITGHVTARLGEKLTLTITRGDSSATAYHEVVQEALKQPMTKEKIAASIEKTGDTMFYFQSLVIDSDDNIFIPVAWLNELRRDAIIKLQEEITNKYRRELKHNGDIYYGLAKSAITFSEHHSQSIISVSVQTQEQYDTALSMKEINLIYVDYNAFRHNNLAEMAGKTCSAGKEFYLMLPHISRLSVYERLKKDILLLMKEESVKGFIIKNFEELALIRSLSINERERKKIVLNYNMYVFNKEAKEFFEELGVTKFTAPIELNNKELQDLGVTDCDLMVYGYLPLMVSAQCLFDNTEGCKRCKTEEPNRSAFLIDRIGKQFIVQTNCNGCYNTIYNGQCLSLLKQSEDIQRLNPRGIRFDFTIETTSEMTQAINAFFDTFLYHKESKWEPKNFTAGHFKRGVE